VTPLESRIRDIIKTAGPISVEKFMQIALSDPEYGYYQTRDPLGVHGDFITSPEISQIFGEIIGLWCVVTWQNAGRPRNIILVELGPGRGTLMADILETIKKISQEFINALKIHLIETSPPLKQQQNAILKDYEITWHNDVETIPSGPALIIANEFFDALPIEQYVMTKNGWHIRHITIDKKHDNLSFITVPLKKKETAIFPNQFSNAKIGSIFERNAVSEGIMKYIAERIRNNGIASLIIDYGHTQTQLGETLQAVKSHKYHNPLTDIGEIDLTSHVDFKALAATSESSGARVHGPTTQRDFFRTLGIEERTKVLAAKAEGEQVPLLLEGSRRLIAKDGMGVLFKVMAITPKEGETPAGFELNLLGNQS
jgi:NADH dehydrogenase [ubiquinone] 1 alpha subcomplex assembly factor 7